MVSNSQGLMLSQNCHYYIYTNKYKHNLSHDVLLMSRFETNIDNGHIVTRYDLVPYVASDFISSLYFLDQDNGITIVTRLTIGGMTWDICDIFQSSNQFSSWEFELAFLGVPSDFTVSNCKSFSLREIWNSRFLN